MKAFLKKISFYTLIGIIIFNLIAFLLLKNLESSQFYKPQFVKTTLEQEYDYVVLGSSTGLTTLNTILIDSLTSLKGLNISMDDTSLQTHYLMLQHFYFSGKTTKKLVLAVTPWDLETDKSKIGKNDYRFLPHISEKYVYDYYSKNEKRNFKPLTYSKYFPIIGVSYFNTEIVYPSLLVAFSKNRRNRFDNRGNYSYPSSGKPKDKKNDEVKLRFKNPYFFKIKEFCDVNKIELVVYQSPIYNTRVIDESKGLTVNHSNLLKKESYFYDEIHVNNQGRKKCTLNFISYLNTSQ